MQSFHAVRDAPCCPPGTTTWGPASGAETRAYCSARAESGRAVPASLVRGPRWLFDGRRARERPFASCTGDRDANVLGRRPAHRSHDSPRWPVPLAPGHREAISWRCRRHNIASNTTGLPVIGSANSPQIRRNSGCDSLGFNAAPFRRRLTITSEGEPTDPRTRRMTHVVSLPPGCGEEGRRGLTRWGPWLP